VRDAVVTSCSISPDSRRMAAQRIAAPDHASRRVAGFEAPRMSPPSGFSRPTKSRASDDIESAEGRVVWLGPSQSQVQVMGAFVRGMTVLAIIAGVAGVTAPSAGAATVRAHWGFNEPGTPTTAVDDSGNSNNGANRAIVGTGDGYTFNGSNSAVIVPNSASLNPGTANFSFAATLVTQLPAAGTDYDVLRKGLASTTGGEYKIEVVRVNGQAKALCLVKDAAKHVASLRWAPAGGLADGRQHTITCSKTPTGVTLQVDAFAPRTKTNANGIGSISNTSSLFIGVKASGGGDAFAGTLYDAWVS
jgi:hypothetical protein